VFTDYNTVVNAYHYEALRLMSEIAGALGKTQDQVQFANDAQRVKNQINKLMFNPKTGLYRDGIGTDHSSLHANVYPLAYGIVPEKNRLKILDFVRSRGMAGSVYTAQALLDGIYNANDAGYGLQLLSATDDRSWYNMIRVGSTISLEAWDNKYKTNQDWNHIWGAAAGNIIARKLMGIEPLDAGFKKIRIKPQPATLGHAEIQVPSIRGDIRVAFDNHPANERFSLQVEIPANSVAEIWLPKIATKYHLTVDDAEEKGTVDGHFVKVNTGSGKHRLVIEKTTAPSATQNLPRFAVLSDTHIGRKDAEEKTVRALKNLLSKRPLPDALFVVGDLTNNGLPEQYDGFLSIISDKANVPDGIPVYLMGGFNHDFEFGPAKRNKDTPEEAELRKTTKDYTNYQKKIRQPLNQYIEIKGYPFITLSEGGSELTSEANVTALKFLEEKMEYAIQKFPGKPVFVFVHVPQLNTCYGSFLAWSTDLFLPVLNRYPQAIVFSAHSHSSIGDPRSIHQGLFTAVNDGSTAYLTNEPCGLTDKLAHSEEITEGLMVNVLRGGNVEIERWNTCQNEEILPKWVVKAPHDGNHFTYKDRTGLPAPAFAKKAKPEIKQDGNSVKVVFPQATDNEVVELYIVEITADGKVVASFRTSSQYYLNSKMPATLTVAFSGLPAEKKLTAQVIAVDSYKHQSVAIKSDEFIIQQ
jgi:hypothetical protein